MVGPLQRNRDFVLLNAGQMLSSAGSAVSSLAYPLLVLSLTHSPAKAGIVSFARLLPAPVFGLAAGIVADRVDRKRVMIAGDAVRGLAMVTLAATIVWHPSFWPIPVLAFVEGIGDTFFSTAQVGAVRSVVPIGQLPAAVSVQQARSAAVSVAAPPLGGLLYAAGRAVPFIVDAVSYVFSFAFLMAIRRPFQQSRERDEMPLPAQLAEGFRFLWGQPFVRATSFLYAVGNFTIPGILFVLVVAARGEGLTSVTIGIMFAAFSTCILVGAAISGIIRRALSVRAVMLLEFNFGLGLVAFVIWPNTYVLLAAMLPQAICLPISDSLVHGYRIAMIPDRLLGRVEAVRATISRSTQPLGPLLAGLLITASSARITIGVFLACNAALAVSGWLTPALRELPDLAELQAA